MRRCIVQRDALKENGDAIVRRAVNPQLSNLLGVTEEVRHWLSHEVQDKRERSKEEDQVVADQLVGSQDEVWLVFANEASNNLDNCMLAAISCHDEEHHESTQLSPSGLLQSSQHSCEYHSNLTNE